MLLCEGNDTSAFLAKVSSLAMGLRSLRPAVIDQ